MQLTVFAEGIQRIKPLLVFRGQGLRIKNSKKEQWHKIVTAQFQKNNWCNEGVMLTWIQNNWGSYFSNPPTPGFDGKLIIADIHQGQQTPKVKNHLRRCKTQLGNITGGLTGYVQMLHVVVNKAFKANVQSLYGKHIQENLEDYVGVKVSASKRCIFMRKWCGKAWDSISRSSVLRGFKKCGLSTDVDGFKNQEVHTE